MTLLSTWVLTSYQLFTADQITWRTITKVTGMFLNSWVITLWFIFARSAAARRSSCLLTYTRYRHNSHTTVTRLIYSHCAWVTRPFMTWHCTLVISTWAEKECIITEWVFASQYMQQVTSCKKIIFRLFCCFVNNMQSHYIQTRQLIKYILCSWLGMVTLHWEMAQRFMRTTLTMMINYLSFFYNLMMIIISRIGVYLEHSTGRPHNFISWLLCHTHYIV